MGVVQPDRPVIAHACAARILHGAVLHDRPAGIIARAAVVSGVRAGVAKQDVRPFGCGASGGVIAAGEGDGAGARALRYQPAVNLERFIRIEIHRDPRLYGQGGAASDNNVTGYGIGAVCRRPRGVSGYVARHCGIGNGRVTPGDGQHQCHYYAHKSTQQTFSSPHSTSSFQKNKNLLRHKVICALPAVGFSCKPEKD